MRDALQLELTLRSLYMTQSKLEAQQKLAIKSANAYNKLVEDSKTRIELRDLINPVYRNVLNLEDELAVALVRQLKSDLCLISS